MQIVLRAEELFKNGYNCCESMLKASIETLEIPLPDNTYLFGKFFREGIAGSGCVCGALAGGIMLLGFLNPEGQDVAKEFRNRFVEKFGSTCCRVIRNKQTITQKFRARECREITKFSAALLQELLAKQD